MAVYMKLTLFPVPLPGTETSQSKKQLLVSKEETTDINLDLVHAFDIDFNHVTMPARPDLLLLPSDLKPFAKVSYFFLESYFLLPLC